MTVACMQALDTSKWVKPAHQRQESYTHFNFQSVFPLVFRPIKNGCKSPGTLFLNYRTKLMTGSIYQFPDGCHQGV